MLCISIFSLEKELRRGQGFDGRGREEKRGGMLGREGGTVGRVVGGGREKWME